MYKIIDGIVDHCTNGQAIGTDNVYTDTPSGQKLHKTMIDWELCCRWRDIETSWVNLKDIKDSYPLEVAEYAVANKILTEPAFS